ncbi:HAMP domain-containing protein [Scytonema hofmannii PCC 7110]|uniref:HAMP domain-containing protein n=1 Tax=Scytonema hofmannii PCC 7110 TaxID=128403 RepID=A0A139XEH9_9CYAN|nr:cache domain-containing protein [Scytonema hofmannii]KYC43095.1 HAMP domain-containing protein [Scytonema hofmannii PCC 7110]
MKNLHRLFYIPAWPIATKISVALMSAVFIPMSFTAYYNLRESLDRVETAEYRKLELLATSTASRLDQLIVDIQHLVIQVSGDLNVVDFLSATTPNQRKSLRPRLEKTLENIYRSNPDFDAAYILDIKGQCIAATDPIFIGQNYTFRQYYSSAIQGRAYVSSILMGRTTRRPGLYFSSPVKTESGAIVGVMVLKIKGQGIWTIVDSLRLADQSYAFLIDKEGVIVSHPDKSRLYNTIVPLSLEKNKQILSDRGDNFASIKSLNIPELKVMVRAKQTGHTNYYSDFGKKQMIVGFAPMKIEPWVLGISQSREQFEVPLNHLVLFNVSSVIIVGGITAIIALLLSSKISRPIRSLTAAAQALENEDFNQEAHNSLVKVSNSQDDIGQLVRVYLDMAKKVSMRNQNLKIQVQELRIEIDDTKRARYVEEITGNEHFQKLQKKIQKIQKNQVTASESERDYYQRLQSQVQSLKERSALNLPS